VRLADELLEHWAPVVAGVELRTGSKGRFEVHLEGEEIFSKAKLNSFPSDGEVARILQHKLGPPPRWRPTHK
jgi:selT/selW/selH-like putative selenoprotein